MSQRRVGRQHPSRLFVGTAVDLAPTSARRSRRSARGTSRGREGRPEGPPPVVALWQMTRLPQRPSRRPQAGRASATRSRSLRRRVNNPSREACPNQRPDTLAFTPRSTTIALSFTSARSLVRPARRLAKSRPSVPPRTTKRRKSRQTQYKTISSLGALVGVAGVALGAGLFVDNVVFWFGAVSIFFLACAAIVAWAAKSLGVFAELAELFAVQTRTWPQEVHRQVKKLERAAASDNDDASDSRLPHRSSGQE